MGVYELMESKAVNGRGVWQMAGGGVENFMYYASNKYWYICNGRETMEAGEGAGAMKVASTALTPNQVTETWQVDGTPTGWLDAPKVRARMCSAKESEEKRAAAERLEQERQQAMEAARQVRDIHRLDSIWTYLKSLAK
jgi:hypothetical protein